MSIKSYRKPMWIGVWVLGLVVISLLDWPLVRFAVEYKPRFRHSDLYYVLHFLGAFPAWLFLGLAFWLMDCGGKLCFKKHALERAQAILLSPIFAGLAVAVLKLVMRRERPDLKVGAYVFRPFTENTFAGEGLGLPSSHTAVVFAGMLTLARLCPSIRYLCYLLALGTAAQRVISSAHYPSDVYIGATIGALSVSLTWLLHCKFGTGALLNRRNMPNPIEDA